MSLPLIASGRPGLTSRSRRTPVPHHSTDWERIGLRDVKQCNLSNTRVSITPTRKPSLSEIHLKIQQEISGGHLRHEPSRTNTHQVLRVHPFENFYTIKFIQGVPGGMGSTSGECSLC